MYMPIMHVCLPRELPLWKCSVEKLSLNYKICFLCTFLYQITRMFAFDEPVNTHLHTQRPRVSNQGNGQCLLKLGTRKGKTSHEWIREERRTDWTVLPLPEIRGRSVYDPPQSETQGKTPFRRRWLLFYICFVVFKEILPAESDSLWGVDVRLTGGVEVLHSQLPWTKQFTLQLIT